MGFFLDVVFDMFYSIFLENIIFKINKKLLIFENILSIIINNKYLLNIK